MYQPNYQITNKILTNLITFEKINQELSTLDLLANTELEIIKNTKSLNLFHIAHILGVELSLKDAEKAVIGNKIVTEDARGTIINNYRNILEYIHTATNESNLGIDLNIFFHFNKILLSDWGDAWDVKIRTSNEEKDAFLDTWNNLYDTRIEPLRIQSEVLSLLDWYKINNETQQILKIGILIYRMIRLAPFTVLNKLTIIAIGEFLLMKAGYENIKYIPFTRIFDLSEVVIKQSIMEAKSKEENSTAFLEQFIQGLLFNVQDTFARIKRTTSTKRKATSKPFLDLNKRQLKILRYLQTIPTVRREDYVQMMDVSPMTSFRDLSQLVSKKLLKVEGQGRSTKYMLVNR